MISVAVSYSGANEQAELIRQGQFTDRYSKAVEQLGTPGVSNVTVRLGGIYALQRLAHDSEADKGTIIQVLAAFLRDPAGRPKSNPPRNVVSSSPTDLARNFLSSSPTDVTAALTVLNHLRGSLRGVDLRGADLRHADLADADLSGALLFGVDLSGAWLYDAHLSGAFLFGADLSDAHLAGADLTGADLLGGNLTRADLTGANLTHANLTHANLSHADLTRANLTHANLTGANLTGVKGLPPPAPTGIRPS